MFEIVRRIIVSMYSPLANSQIGGRFEWRAAGAADHGGTVAASERIGDFVGAVGAIERFRRRPKNFWLSHGVCDAAIKLLNVA
jgi:hypothetical protein